MAAVIYINKLGHFIQKIPSTKSFENDLDYALYLTGILKVT